MKYKKVLVTGGTGFIGKPAGKVVKFISGLLGIYSLFNLLTVDWMSRDTNVYDCSEAKKVAE